MSVYIQIKRTREYGCLYSNKKETEVNMDVYIDIMYTSYVHVYIFIKYYLFSIPHIIFLWVCFIQNHIVLTHLNKRIYLPLQIL